MRLALMKGLNAGNSALSGVNPPTASLAHRYIAGVGVTEAGSGISQWDDQVGTAHMVQSTDGARPTVETVFGRESVYSDGSKYLDIPSSVSLSFRACSLYVCCRSELNRPDLDGALLEFRQTSGPAILTIYAAGNTTLGTTDTNGRFAVYNGADRQTSISVGQDCMQSVGMVCGASAVTVYHGSESEAVTGSGDHTSDATGRFLASQLWVAPYRGHVYEVLLYDKEHSATEIAAVQDYFSAKYGAISRDETVFIGIEGDSHSDYGTGVRWPIQFGEKCATSPKIFNDAVGGEETDEMLAETTYGDELVFNAAYTRVALFYGGTNDLLLSSRPAADIKSDIADWCARAYTDGADYVYVCTIFANGNVVGADEVSRLDVNAWIKSTLSVDGYVDLAADSRLSNPADTTYYLVDATHLTTAGFTVMSDLIHAKLKSEGHVK